MTRVIEMRRVVVVVVAAVAFMGQATWSTGAFAQGASPDGTQQQGQTAHRSMVEGKIMTVSGSKVTLDDGTELMIPSDVMKTQRAELKPGATIRVSFEQQGGQKVVKSIAVGSAK